MPHSIKTEPNIVYKKNCNTACIFRCRDPQIPIKKNIGINTLSKQTKKQKASNTKNTWHNNNSTIASNSKNSFTRYLILYQLTKIQMLVKNVVKTTKKRDKPSTPKL